MEEIGASAENPMLVPEEIAPAVEKQKAKSAGENVPAKKLKDAKKTKVAKETQLEAEIPGQERRESTVVQEHESHPEAATGNESSRHGKKRAVLPTEASVSERRHELGVEQPFLWQRG